MKIALLTYGSRGDVQPFIALSRALLKVGHAVKLAGPHRFGAFAAAHRVPYVPLAGDPEEISRRLNDAGANPLRMMSEMRAYVQSIAAPVARAAFAACQGMDLILHSFLFTTGAHSLARQLGIPDISVQLFPMFLPTREFPNVAVPGLPAGPLSYLSHWLAGQAFWYAGNLGYRQLYRQAPDLLPARLYWPFAQREGRLRTPVLCAWSPSLLPMPGDWPKDSLDITGYWFLDPDQDDPPPAQLIEFLAAGGPPLCISFGSMIHRKAAHLQAEIVKALSRTGERAVVLTGWQPWQVEPHPGLLFLPQASHAWLFPRCKAVIHHGGAGTTAAVARAGLPGVALPFAADQKFWADRLHALGVAPRAVWAERLTSAWLVEALHQLEQPALREKARQLGAAIRSEDGLTRALQHIESCFQSSVPRAGD